MIWNGAGVLGSAWEDVRQVRESDKILALLESETGRLQNLIHRYINQPSPELFAEILLLREAVLGTLTTRGIDRSDVVRVGGGAGTGHRALSQRLWRIARRPDDHFEDLRGSGPDSRAGRWPGSIRSSRAPPGAATPRSGLRSEDSREAFTAMLVAVNAYYLSLAAASAEEARRTTETIEKTIPIMSDFADNDLQRMALQRLKVRAVALREGLAQTFGAARHSHRAVAQYHRCQPGRRHRRHRRIVGQDAPARAEGAGDVRSHAGLTSRAGFCRSP